MENYYVSCVNRADTDDTPARCSWAAGTVVTGALLTIGVVLALGWSTSVAAQSGFGAVGLTRSTPTNGVIQDSRGLDFGPPPQMGQYDDDGDFGTPSGVLYDVYHSRKAAWQIEDLAFRARASMTGNPDRLSALTSFDIENFEGRYNVVAGSEIQPLYETVNSYSTYTNRLTASDEARALMNMYSERTLSLSIAEDVDVRQAFYEAAAANGDNNSPEFKSELEISRIDAVFSTLLYVNNASATGDWGGSNFRQQGYLSIDSKVSIREIAFRTEGEGLLGFRTEVEGSNFYLSRVYLNEVEILNDPYLQDFEFTGLDNIGVSYSIPFEFFPGYGYNINISSGCGAIMFGAALLYPGTAASCDASRSSYWNGLTNVRGPDGKPLPDFQLTDSNGYNFRNASPLSPAPATDVDAIPEPGSWVMLIMGFGLVGFVARQHKETAPRPATA